MSNEPGIGDMPSIQAFGEKMPATHMLRIDVPLILDETNNIIAQRELEQCLRLIMSVVNIAAHAMAAGTVDVSVQPIAPSLRPNQPRHPTERFIYE